MSDKITTSTTLSPFRIVFPATGEPVDLALDDMALWARAAPDAPEPARQIVASLSLGDTFTVTFKDGEEAEALRKLLGMLEARTGRALGRFQRLGDLARQGKISIEPRKEEP
jgi:hypothetical protein